MIPLFSCRIELLESHLEEYRRRESAETSSLEKAMEQIEKNLKLAVVSFEYFLKVYHRIIFPLN